MPVQKTSSLALIVRSYPYQHRSARAELDVALAALVMDFRLEVYFLGAAFMQLLVEREVKPALLPAAYRAWASLPDLGKVTLFAEESWLDRYREAQFRLPVPIQGLQVDRMQDGWRRCDYSVAL
jgi:sulfur relay (sulfurtransferase) DsrF/TusC family protein